MPNEFAITHVAYQEFPTFIKVRTLTFAPVHLICHYTSQEPVRHRQSMILRGLAVPQGAYWCFVATKQVEQEEAGDTLVHTFTIPSWLPGVRYWLVWTGTIASIESPSLSVFIDHTHTDADPYLTEEQTTWGWTSSIADGFSWGQLMPMPRRELASLSFVLWRSGFPGGVVDYYIAGFPIETDLWHDRLGNANSLSTTPTWYTIPFTTPTIMVGTVRMYAQASAGGPLEAVGVRISLTDVKPNEQLLRRTPAGAYTYFAGLDFLYRYTYANWKPYLLPFPS